MDRGGPRLPETLDQARDVLADQEFFVPRSELPAETDARRAYVRRLHIVLAKTARRFEHSKQVVAGEQPLDSDPELPGSLSEAEASLEDRSFFVPVADLPDDPDRIGEYVETLHLRLARAARALTHNRRVLREREGSGDGDDTPGERHTSTDEGSTVEDETGEEPTAEDETGEESTTGAGGSADSVSAPDSETADVAGGTAGESTSAGSRADGSAGDDAETAPGQDTGEETGTDTTEESGGEQRDRFVYGQFDRSEDDSPADDTVDRSDRDREGEADGESEGEAEPRGLDEIDDTAGTGDVAEADDETGSRTLDGTEETGLERRQLLFGGATIAVLVAAVGGGLAVLLSDDGDGAADGSADQANGGDTDGTTPESTNGDGGVDDTGSTADGGDGGDSTGDGADENWTFELAEFEADATPAAEYVELAYTGEGEQDISGYRLYDGEDGRAHPTEPNSLDPFSFPDGTVLSAGESVRVYTGPGESGDGVFHWGYEVNIWNQDGDTVVLEDTTGSVVFETQYGPQG